MRRASVAGVDHLVLGAATPLAFADPTALARGVEFVVSGDSSSSSLLSPLDDSSLEMFMRCRARSAS